MKITFFSTLKLVFCSQIAPFKKMVSFIVGISIVIAVVVVVLVTATIFFILRNQREEVKQELKTGGSTVVKKAKDTGSVNAQPQDVNAPTYVAKKDENKVPEEESSDWKKEALLGIGTELLALSSLYNLSESQEQQANRVKQEKFNAKNKKLMDGMVEKSIKAGVRQENQKRIDREEEERRVRLNNLFDDDVKRMKEKGLENADDYYYPLGEPAIQALTSVEPAVFYNGVTGDATKNSYLVPQSNWGQYTTIG